MISICIDFDGVIHSYTSKWTNAETISDTPVEGAIEAIEKYLEYYKVYIFSTRCKEPNAIIEMKRWLHYNGMHFSNISKLNFTYEKVQARLYIDDRGYHFQGLFPTIEYIQCFKPWNKK